MHTILQIALAAAQVQMGVCTQAGAEPSRTSNTRAQILPRHTLHRQQQPLLVDGQSGLTLAGGLGGLFSGCSPRPWLGRNLAQPLIHTIQIH